MSYKDTRQELQKSIQSNFINTPWRFLHRRTATKAIVSSPSHPDKDGLKFSRQSKLGFRTMVGEGWTEDHLAFKLMRLIPAIFNTENYSQIFLVFPRLPGLKSNIHFMCTTNRSNIKDLGKAI